MAKPASGGAGGSGGRQRKAEEPYFEIAPSNRRGDPETIDRASYANVIQPLYDAQTNRVENSERIVFKYESAGFQINTMLRKAKGNPDLTNIRTYEQQMVVNMDKIMQPADRNMVVYRGVSLPFSHELFAGGDLVGKTIGDHGYLSTSMNKSLAQFFHKKSKKNSNKVLVKIKVPKGAQVIYTNPNGKYAGQYEIVLNRNGKLRITSAEIVGGVYNIEAELVN